MIASLPLFPTLALKTGLACNILYMSWMIDLAVFRVLALSSSDRTECTPAMVC